MTKDMSKSRGFTLLEILVVLVLLAIIGGFAIGKVVRSFNAEARGLTWRMASTVKYLYNTAATENKTIRLVFDFETNSYWAEATSERFLLDKNADQKKEAEQAEEGKEGEEAAPTVKPLVAEFGPIVTPLLETYQLPPSLFIKDVYTSHDDGPVTEGRAFVYFFPSGYAEPAVINFRDSADERHISVKVEPFSGGVEIKKEYQELEGSK